MAPIHQKRLLVITSSFPSSEVSQNVPGFIRELCESFIRNSYTVDVLAPYHDGAKLEERFGEVTVYRYRYALPSMHNLTQQDGILASLKQSRIRIVWVPFMFFSLFWTAKKMLKKNKYDLIHAHQLIPQGWVCIKLLQHLKLNIPLLTTSHGIDLYSLKGNFWRSIKLKVLRKSTHITVVNQVMKQYCLSEFNIPESKISVINIGVDLQRLFHRLDCVQRQAETLLFVGELQAQKGLKHLIHAIPEISKTFPDIKLYIVGDGPEKNNLKLEAKAYGCEHRIFFVGAQAAPTVALYLNKVRLLIVPPIPAAEPELETLGSISIEAMGCRCPVLVSDIPPLKEIISHQKTGVIFKAGNSKDLAKKAIWALSNPKAIETITETAHKFVQKKFEMNSVGDRYAQLIGKFLR